MKRQVFNPYLPSYEYIPDGEPHIFNGRLYIYGSHDRFGAGFFCDNDYVLWSAPVDDLSDWTYHGVIYKKEQDPLNAAEKNPLFAPDVTQGSDGRYYLYYCPCNTKSIGVAVADTPEGPFEFLNHVRYENKKLLGQNEYDPYPFDPAVLHERDKTYLYIGFAPDLSWDFMEKEFGSVPLSSGPYVSELDEDMYTCKRLSKIEILNCEDKGHDFFEAASIRKFDDTYYFIYSSWNSHELCYATGKDPKGPFPYQGILHDNGDIGIQKEDDRVCYTGNNHGSLIRIKDSYYIFGHRQTNYSAYARQGIAEKIRKNEDGSFTQAELTSCGLNDGDLIPEGTYGAYIACHLTAKNGASHYVDQCDEDFMKNNPAFSQDGQDRENDPDQYIKNMRDGSTCGFKYFGYKKEVRIDVTTRGEEGVLEVRTSLHGPVLCHIPLEQGSTYHRSKTVSFELDVQEKFPLYFTYRGNGYIDLLEFTLS